MFLAYKRTFPKVECLIFDQLGPRDLVRSKQVCKGWAMAVRRCFGQLGSKRKSDLMEEAFLEPIQTYATVTLPSSYPGRPSNVRDLTINDMKEVYVLGDGCIMQFDSANFKVSKTMSVDTIPRWVDHKKNPKAEMRIYASQNGKYFEVNGGFFDCFESCQTLLIHGRTFEFEMSETTGKLHLCGITNIQLMG